MAEARVVKTSGSRLKRLKMFAPLNPFIQIMMGLLVIEYRNSVAAKRTRQRLKLDRVSR